MAESIDNGSSNEKKVALFRNLFFGRQDVYARRFENAKSGRSGYFPECANKWKRESSWRRDVAMIVKIVRKLGLPVALERSRSGKGAHLWFFLGEDIAARTVRAALTYLLTVTLEEHPEIGLSSYDRIIPCQDTLTKGGLGNLIALPLQREPRQMLTLSVQGKDDTLLFRFEMARSRQR